MEFQSKTSIFFSYRLGKTYKIKSHVPDCESVKFCIWKIVTYIWTKFSKVPSWIRCWREWFYVASKIYWFISKLDLKAQVKWSLSVPLNVLTKLVLIIVYSIAKQCLRISNFWMFVEESWSAIPAYKAPNWSDFSKFFDFLVLPDSLKIAWFDIFSQKGFIKACPCSI